AGGADRARTATAALRDDQRGIPRRARAGDLHAHCRRSRNHDPRALRARAVTRPVTRRVVFVLVVLVSVWAGSPAPSASATPAGTRWTRELSADPFGIAGDRAGYVVTVQPDEVVAFDRRGHELWHAVVREL